MKPTRNALIRISAFALALVFLLGTVFTVGFAVATPSHAAETAPELTNVALGQSIMASSNYLPPEGFFDVEQAVDGIWAPYGQDGNNSIGWNSNPADSIGEDTPIDITVTLDKVYDIHEILLYPQMWGHGKSFPRDYDLQVSLTGADWTTVVSDKNVDRSAASDAEVKPVSYRLETPVSARYFRMHITRNSTEVDGGTGSYLSALGEIELMGVESTVTDEPAFEWPAPTYTEQETVREDTFGGTLTYTPSADGTEMTISYEVAGETVSYTVPNNANYLSGGFAGVDDLGRPLYSSEEVGSYEAGKKYIGLFYFLWQGEHGDNGIFDLQKIIDSVGVEAAGSTACGKYGPIGAMHFFAEPLYGYYYASDAWVLRKHAELLTNANIDFLYFDVTNGYPYIKNALALMDILHQLNEEGYDAPQVVFYTHTSADSTVQQIYNNIYKAEKYPDTWFCIDGKPVIVAPENISLGGGKSITDVFTVKREQWPNDPAINENAWPWMDFEWPQRIFTDKTGKPSAVSVSIAQHSGSVQFSTSSLYNDYTNRGRSFSTPTTNYSVNLRKSYESWQADPSLTMQGLNFQAQFDYAIASEAEFILVTGWNEWVAQRQPNPTTRQDDGTIRFVDTSSMEFSRDAEMMRGGYFDNYYMQLIYNVQKAKGSAPVVVQDSRKPINVTGEFDQWEDVLVTYQDPTGDTVDRNATGFGKQMLVNTSGRNDIAGAKVTADTKNVYFYVDTVDTVTKYDTESSWMQLYVNADRDASTGWYGYDYIINHAAKDAFTTTVAKYNGENGAYSCETVGEVSYRVAGNQMMIAVPQEMLGIENYYEVDLEFKWADSKTTYDEMEDFYCDGDVAPLGRLNYVYQNYIEGKSTPPASETETEPVTETEPETPVESDTLPETAPDTEHATQTEPVSETLSEAAPETEEGKDQGCASAVAVASTALLCVLASAAVVLRKKD